MKKRVIYYFCTDGEIDPVAGSVFQYLKDHYPLGETAISVDNHKVLFFENDNSLFWLVEMDDVLSHAYDKYLPIMNQYFTEFDMAGAVNWHAGSNAPEHVLTVHSIGDVPSGVYAPSNPGHIKSIFTSLEKNRKKYGLDNFRVLVEATHWSGIPYNQSPFDILKYNVPIYDIEIGSEPESWGNPDAIQVLAESLLNIEISETPSKSIIGVGGKHFEDCFSDLLRNEEFTLSIGHILPNQWVAISAYEGDAGKQKLEDCYKSIAGSVTGIVFHDNLKGAYKQLCRDIAANHNISCIKHKALKNVDTIKNLEQ